MMVKGSKLYSIFRMKCPHCAEGEFFKSRNPYNLRKAGECHDSCSVCGRKFSKEPGFYYGAMYVAYALGVALFVAIFVAIYVIYPEATTEWYIGGVSAGIVVAGPYIYALSKIMWAHMFFSYKGVAKTADELKAEQERLNRQAQQNVA
jgi:uncharacterized protein (DUF983 family)